MGDVQETIYRAERMLKASYAGLKQYERAEGEERVIGLMNAVQNGRNVTWVLQKGLSGKAEGFEDWYGERQAVMGEDPVFERMKHARNEVTKEGGSSTAGYASVGRITHEIAKKQPPWADGIFIGDKYGGSGFVIENLDGEDAEFYYDFPHEDFETGLTFSQNEGDDPEMSELVDVKDDLKYYIKVLAEIVRDAKEEFGQV